MCNCKMCNWLKSLFGKKNCCETKGCCEEKKAEEIKEEATLVTPVESLEEKKEEEKVA